MTTNGVEEVKRCRHGVPHGRDCGSCDLYPDASPGVEDVVSGRDAMAELNLKPRGACNRCGRKFWKAETAGSIDSMVQPDGGICGAGSWLKGFAMTVLHVKFMLAVLLALLPGCASHPRTTRVVTAIVVGSVAVTLAAHGGQKKQRVVTTPAPPDCTARPTVCQ